MLSPNPHYSSYRVTIPNEFFIPQVSDKYNNIINQYKYPLKSIESMFKESLQSVDFPSFGYTPHLQGVTDVNNAGYDWFQPSKTSEQLLAEQKILEFSFRHSNSFLTYFYALELFFTRYQMGPNNPTNRQPFGTIILETFDDQSRNPVCRMKFHKCNLIGLSNLSLTYSDPKRDMDNFTLTIQYTEFETSMELPELVLK